MTSIAVYPCTDGTLPRPRRPAWRSSGCWPCLTVSVAIEQGVDVLVVLSLVILALLGIGVIGALDVGASG